MRLAFIDIVFSWPPLGGAPLDLYYTMSGLQALGHDVHLFYASDPENWRLEPVARDALPFPSTELACPHGASTPETTAQRFREGVDAWGPDVVFQCFGFFTKPYVTMALAHYPQIARYYAYEPFCPRDYRMFLNHDICPMNYLRSPNVCRRCAASLFWREMRTGRSIGYVSEYEQARAYSSAYYHLLVESLREYRAVIVYNQLTKGLLEGITDRVHVIGGGVEIQSFEHVPLEDKPAGEKKVIFMSGRAEDFSKGTRVLQRAGEILAAERDDFEIWLTHPERELENEWFKPIGWHPFERIVSFYKQSDICVVPSLWQEPFGMVAVEAMAIGRPVVVSNVGGLQEIVVQGETGYVYDRRDAEALAGHLRDLLDDPSLRRRMGDAGRARAAQYYDWKQVIERHYPPLLEEVTR